jgi:NTP pyrophosphatase (non-canonical NTP hydrolase)
MTQFSELQRRIVQIRAERGFVTDPLKIYILLTEEVGEVSSELQRLWSKNYDDFDTNRLADELADVFVLLTALANAFEIDLEEAVQTKFVEKDAQREWKSRPE